MELSLCCLWLLVTILTATFATLLYARCIENTTNDCITETDVFDATATEEDH